MRFKDLKQHPHIDNLEVTINTDKFGMTYVEVTDGVTVEREINVTPWTLTKIIERLKKRFPTQGGYYE